MTIQEMIFKRTAEVLLVDYSSVYYVNAVTNEDVIELYMKNKEEKGDADGR